MNYCLSCGKSILDKYIYCQGCNEKRNPVSNSLKSDEIINELSKINNNLYFLRVALSLILEKQFKMEVYWDKKTKKFEKKHL